MKSTLELLMLGKTDHPEKLRLKICNKYLNIKNLYPVLQKKRVLLKMSPIFSPNQLFNSMCQEFMDERSSIRLDFMGNALLIVFHYL